MTALEALGIILGLSAAEIQNVQAMLKAIIARFPDTAKELEPFLAKLEEAVTPAALAALGPSILAEALALAVGKFDPRSHAGDVI